MKLTTQSFRGMAPRITPRALPENASQQAINAQLLTGDLQAWRRPELVESLANAGVVSSIFPLEDIWLSYEEEVEFARGAVIDDDADPRVYITGLDAPRFTTYALATLTGGSPPYPAETRLLGVPAPATEPAVVVTIPEPDESNITLTNPGAEAGNTSGWVIDSGALDAIEDGDIPGLDAQTGTWFFGGGAAAATEAHQDVDLEALGVIAGQGLTLSWWQAGGANDSTAAMKIEFYDDAAQLLSEVAGEELAISPDNTWEQRTLSAQVPDGAVTARLVQVYTRVGAGPDIDAYIDTITLNAIAYTNAFDGSTLAGWTTSPNEGGATSTIFRRVEIDNTVGWPAPSFRFRGDSRVPYFYRNFNTDRSPSVTMQFDYLELFGRTNCGLHAVLFGSDGGVATSVFFSSWIGVRLYTNASWDGFGANVEEVAPSLPAGVRYTVILTATQTSETSASLVIRVINAETSEVLVDDVQTTISVDGPNIGFKASVNFEDRRYWIDNISVTVAAPNPNQDDETTYTSYVFTYVNEFGEESAPSDPSDTVQRNENATTIVTTPTTLPTGVSEDYGIETKRIYRAVTGALGTVFRFVAEIPLEQADYEDTLEDADLGEELETEDWDLPPSDLRYILALPNGIMVGASANRLCFSVQNRPHAWPIAWRLAIDSNITGLGNVDNSVVVGSETFVYTASGNSPDAYSMSKPVAPHSCQSARSVAFLTGIGVVFAGPDGLMAVSGPTEVRNLTEGIFTREQWQAIQPSTILGIAHDDRYFFFARANGEALPTPEGAAVYDRGDVLLEAVSPNAYDVGSLGWEVGPEVFLYDADTTNFSNETPFVGVPVANDFVGGGPGNERAVSYGSSDRPMLSQIDDDDREVSSFYDDDGSLVQVNFTFPESVGINRRYYSRRNGLVNFVASFPANQTVYQFNATTGAFVQSGALGAGEAAIGITDTGAALFILFTVAGIRQYNRTTLAFVQTIAATPGQCYSLGSDPDGNLYAYCANGEIYRLDGAAWTLFAQIQDTIDPGDVHQAPIVTALGRFAQVFYISAPDVSRFYSQDEGAGGEGFVLDMNPSGFGLMELGMHATAVATVPSEDALMIVLDAYEEPESALLPPDTAVIGSVSGRSIYEWDGGGTTMRYSWRGKLWLNPYPKAWAWVRVRAQDYDDLELQVYADGDLLHQQIVTDGRPFRLPMVAEANEVEWVAIGTSRVRSVELADDSEELV